MKTGPHERFALNIKVSDRDLPEWAVKGVKEGKHTTYYPSPYSVPKIAKMVVLDPGHDDQKNHIGFDYIVSPSGKVIKVEQFGLTFCFDKVGGQITEVSGPAKSFDFLVKLGKNKQKFDFLSPKTNKHHDDNHRKLMAFTLCQIALKVDGLVQEKYGPKAQEKREIRQHQKAKTEPVKIFKGWWA